VIALANSTDDNFGKETVSFLTTIKQSFESVLEIVEKKKKAIEHEMQQTKVRDIFSSYVSRTVAEEILKDPDKLELGGEQQEVTVMFSEVMNFIDLTESVQPEALISMLNEYFSVAIDTVFEFDGTLDKFIEDNVMAYWGAPLPVPDSEIRAIQCAMKLQRVIEDLNKKWESENKPSFHVCIGLNSGKVVAGNIGSIRRMEYTVIGDTVNLAARIKTLSKSRNIPILVGEKTHEMVRHSFNFEDAFRTTVKGKTGDITVFQLKVEET
jgi:adenylate cyclase